MSIWVCDCGAPLEVSCSASISRGTHTEGALPRFIEQAQGPLLAAMRDAARLIDVQTIVPKAVREAAEILVAAMERAGIDIDGAFAPEEESHRCATCGRAFTTESGLGLHMRHACRRGRHSK